MPRRPLNKCDNFGYTWYPKGKNLSKVCPNCKNSNVRIYRNWPGFFIVVHLLVFFIAIYLRADLSWAGVLQILKAKRGWIEPAGLNANPFLWEIGEFEYDVALSFAGEDREYADQIAHILTWLRQSKVIPQFFPETNSHPICA
jgi:RNA polymerase subunit RPABC4/transcription elongation factor Spt4